MKNGLLIVGAGVYGLVAREIAEGMGCFEKIAFLDDSAKGGAGLDVVGGISDIEALAPEYKNAVVAIGNSAFRLELMERLRVAGYNIPSLISPMAYVSPSAKIGAGVFVEPMAVVHCGCEICDGCIISAGAVVNHKSVCHPGCHIDCNGTVAGNEVVPPGTKVPSGAVFSSKQNGKIKPC